MHSSKWSFEIWREKIIPSKVVSKWKCKSSKSNNLDNVDSSHEKENLKCLNTWLNLMLNVNAWVSGRRSYVTNLKLRNKETTINVIH